MTATTLTSSVTSADGTPIAYDKVGSGLAGALTNAGERSPISVL
jgi:hypothetical protein